MGAVGSPTVPGVTLGAAVAAGPGVDAAAGVGVGGLAVAVAAVVGLPDSVAAGLAGPLALGLGLTARAVPSGVAPTTTANTIDASPAATTRRPIQTGWRTKRDKRLTISLRPLSRSAAIATLD